MVSPSEIPGSTHGRVNVDPAVISVGSFCLWLLTLEEIRATYGTLSILIHRSFGVIPTPVIVILAKLNQVSNAYVFLCKKILIISLVSDKRSKGISLLFYINIIWYYKCSKKVIIGSLYIMFFKEQSCIKITAYFNYPVPWSFSSFKLSLDRDFVISLIPAFKENMIRRA